MAPKISEMYKDYFGDSEEPEEQNQKQVKNQRLQVLGADSSQIKVKEFKFYFFIPIDFENVIESHLNSKKRLLAKFYNDEDILIKDIAEKSKDINELVRFKSAYAEYLQKGIAKLNKKRLVRIIKIKASLQILTYFKNKNTTFKVKALKILTIDSKTPQYATKERMQRQQKYLKVFIQDVNQKHNDFKVKNLKKLQEEEQKEQEEMKKEEEEQETQQKDKKSNQNKLMSLLKKIKPSNLKKKNAKENAEEIDTMLKKRILEFFKPKQSLKYIKSARLRGYQWLKQNNKSDQKIIISSQAEVGSGNNLGIIRRDAKKTSILIAQSGPSAGQRNSFLNGKRQTMIQGQAKSTTPKKNEDKRAKKSKVFDDDSDEDEQEPDVHIRLAYKIRRALINKGIIGISKRSLFYDPENIVVRRDSGQLFDMNSDEEINKNKETYDNISEVEGKKNLGSMTAIQKMKKMFKDGRLSQMKIKQDEDLQSKKTFKSSHTYKSSKKIKESSSSSEEDNKFDENQRFIEQKSEDSKIEERNLLLNLERADIKDEEKAIAQSVGSSSSSLNAQNAVRMLRQSLKNMSTPKILKIANFTVILMSITVFFLSFSQFLVLSSDFGKLQDQFDIISRISTYSENTIRFYYNYIDFYMVNQKYYNENNYTPAWWAENKQLVKEDLLNFVNFQLLDLASAGQEKSGQTDLRGYLFQPMKFTMLVAKKPQQQDSNFENYLRLYVNAINQTIDQPTEFFSQNNYLENDYLFFIDTNKDEQIGQNIKNMNDIDSKIKEENNTIMQNFLTLWSLTFFFIFICFVVIYPVMLESKKKIHDSLVLFTRISLRDIDYYEDHFQKIHFFFNSIDNNFHLMREIEKFIESQSLVLQRLIKTQDQRGISRSRDYKGVKIDSLMFLLQISFLMALFLAFVVLKDYKALLFLNELDKLKDYQIGQHSILYNNLVATCNYHELMKNYLYANNQTQFQYDIQNFEKFLNLNNNILENMMDNYRFYGQFDSSYRDFMQQLMEDSICTDILVNLTPQQISSCQTLFEGLLIKGFANFLIVQPQYLKVNVDNLIQQEQTQGYATAREQASQMIKEQKVYDMRYLYEYVSSTTQLWYSKQNDAINQGIDDQIQYNRMMVIFFSLFIFLFLICVWWQAYGELKRNSKWVNSFILLIPIQLHRENKYLRSYLKQKLNINNIVQS